MTHDASPGEGSESGRRPPGTRPPGPTGIPVLGNALQFASDQLGFFARNAAEHGDIVAFDIAGWPSLLLSDSDDIEHVLVKNHRNFVKNSLIWRHFTAVFGQGILTAEGELWQRNRKLAAPAFAGQQLLGYGPQMVELTTSMLGGWRDGQLMDVHVEMMALTLRIAAKALMDSEVDSDIADMDHAVNDLTEEMASRLGRPVLVPDWVPLPGHIRYRRAIATGERVIERMIVERRLNGVDGRVDFLSRLMLARDETGQPLSDTQLRDETLTMLLAGHETTALALSWSLHLLGRDEGATAKLVDEVATVVGARAVTVDDVARLGFAEGVIMEAMRLYPPAWVIGRENVAAFGLRGYDFAPKTTIFVAPWVLHRDCRHFDDPESFRPERWMDGLARRLPRFAYMPFGGGPRICIGQRFAMIEAILILATLFQHFTVEWQSDRPVTPFPSITLRPNGGVWVKPRTLRGAVH